MRQSSAKAAAVLAGAKASAFTDVTGFGLAGHLIEMADAGNVSFSLDLSTLPLISGAEALVTAGVESTMAPANAAFAERISGPVDDSAAHGYYLIRRRQAGLLPLYQQRMLRISLNASKLLAMQTLR